MTIPKLSKAQSEYTGPAELKLFADILPYIGELAISFSRIERRVTWAIESLLHASIQEADEMEAFVKNFSSRVKFLELIGRNIATVTNTESDFSAIIAAVRAANKFRNSAIHNAFVGVSMQVNETGEPSNIAVIKSPPDPKKPSFSISTATIRENVELNFSVCGNIQRWILTVCPDAHNREP